MLGDGGTCRPDGGTCQPDGGTCQPDGGTCQPDFGRSWSQLPKLLGEIHPASISPRRNACKKGGVVVASPTNHSCWLKLKNGRHQHLRNLI